MKSFKQYIEEGVDFRLGGSQNKDGNIKTFKDLKVGDTVFWYRVHPKNFSSYDSWSENKVTKYTTGRDPRNGEEFCIIYLKLAAKLGTNNVPSERSYNIYPRDYESDICVRIVTGANKSRVVLTLYKATFDELRDKIEERYPSNK